MSWACEMLPLSPVQTTRPFRITMIRSATSSDSCKRCEMKMNEIPPLAPSFDVVVKLCGLAGAKRRGGLIEDQEPDLRVASRSRDLDHLLLRQGKRADLRSRVDAASWKHLLHRSSSVIDCQALPAHTSNEVRLLDCKVFEDAKVLAERQFLVDKAKPEREGVPGRRIFAKHLSEKLEPPLVGTYKSADDFHQRAFAGTVAAHKCHDL